MDMTPQAWPDWYDGKHINEVLFCQQFLEKHPMKCVRGRLFTVDGLIEDEGQIGNLILEEISGVLTSGLSKVVTNLLASIKLQAYSPPLPTMEAGLKKLEAQEQKYSAELDKALDEYAELKAQAADFDPVELYKARQGIRPAQEKESEKQLEDAMHEKPSLIMLLGAKQETSRLLGDDADERQVRQILIRRQRSDPQKSKHFQR